MYAGKLVLLATLTQ